MQILHCYLIYILNIGKEIAKCFSMVVKLLKKIKNLFLFQQCIDVMIRNIIAKYCSATKCFTIYRIREIT